MSETDTQEPSLWRAMDVTSFPITCDWCRNSPATHLLVMETRNTRSRAMVCATCAHRDQERAREIAVSPASVWLFRLEPNRCPSHNPTGSAQ